MSDLSAVGIEVGVGVVIIPWAVFVTASIYALRQQVALMRAEVELLKRIEKLVDDSIKHRH